MEENYESKRSKIFNVKVTVICRTKHTDNRFAGMSVEMKTYYSDYLIDIAGPELVHDQFADTYDIPKMVVKQSNFVNMTI